LKEPRRLGPLASAEFFIEHKDLAGGSGAGFLVAWDADEPANEPIAETINAYFFGTQSIAFVGTGRVIQK
jgi:hypothetical protein